MWLARIHFREIEVNYQWISKLLRQRQRTLHWTFMKNYRAITTASVELTWQKVMDLTDLSWHPLISRTNVPCGIVPKPGLIYRAISRWVPLSCRMFVEGVRPRQLLSIRVFGIPGIEERVTYQVESSVCGTYISYSVMMRGWLAPLVWSCLQKQAAKVAAHLAAAAEAESLGVVYRGRRTRKNTCFD
jgi:hypothetical protein